MLCISKYLNVFDVKVIFKLTCDKLTVELSISVGPLNTTLKENLEQLLCAQNCKTIKPFKSGYAAK